jgi:hypothetical protein
MRNLRESAGELHLAVEFSFEQQSMLSYIEFSKLQVPDPDAVAPRHSAVAQASFLGADPLGAQALRPA